MWYRRKVKTGNKLGRFLGHPTLNLSVGTFGLRYTPAVYCAEVRIHGKVYKGALFFGPKLNDKTNVLEIYVIGFASNLYGQFVSFKVGRKIRPPKQFVSLEELKRQIQNDITVIQKL